MDVLFGSATELVHFQVQAVQGSRSLYFAYERVRPWLIRDCADAHRRILRRRSVRAEVMWPSGRLPHGTYRYSEAATPDLGDVHTQSYFRTSVLRESGEDLSSPLSLDPCAFRLALVKTLMHL